MHSRLSIPVIAKSAMPGIAQVSIAIESGYIPVIDFVRLLCSGCRSIQHTDTVLVVFTKNPGFLNNS
jgi:hypothetical protein